MERQTYCAARPRMGGDAGLSERWPVRGTSLAGAWLESSSETGDAFFR